jgi:hypothetical protein
MKLLLALAAMVVLSCSAWGEVEGGCHEGMGMACFEKDFCRSDLQATSSLQIRLLQGVRTSSGSWTHVARGGLISLFQQAEMRSWRSFLP